MRAVLGLGRGLGLPVLAEGVETEGELAFLAAESCAEGQGYFLGRPGPIEDYRDLVTVPSASTTAATADTARGSKRGEATQSPLSFPRRDARRSPRGRSGG